MGKGRDEEVGRFIRSSRSLRSLPKDISQPPREWAERFFNVQRWTEMASGGHFAAMEEPELLAEDIRAWFQTFRDERSGPYPLSLADPLAELELGTSKEFPFLQALTGFRHSHGRRGRHALHAESKFLLPGDNICLLRCANVWWVEVLCNLQPRLLFYVS
jgi:hypothetical protein